MDCRIVEEGFLTISKPELKQSPIVHITWPYQFNQNTIGINPVSKFYWPRNQKLISAGRSELTYAGVVLSRVLGRKKAKINYARLGFLGFLIAESQLD